MQTLEVIVVADGKKVIYTLNLHYKRMKNIVFRAVENEVNQFNVSLPYGIRLSEVEKVFLKNLKSLTKLGNKSKMPPFGDKTYVFGKLLPLREINDTFGLKGDLRTIELFYKAMHKTFLKVLKAEVNYYREKMEITPLYKVRLRAMKTRWATNSKQTMTLTFNEKLVHYNLEIIRALVVHELVHFYIGGHGKDFYDLCERYYPNYKQFDKKLKEQQYDGNY